MEISYALKTIKENILTGHRFSIHFKDKLKERNLSELEFLDLIRTMPIVGISLQNKQESKYKVWYDMDATKDLNIILSISHNKEIILISIFPTMKKRRLR